MNPSARRLYLPGTGSRSIRFSLRRRARHTSRLAVTIVRDGERFLTEALDSALGQRYSKLELIVVDDGSTDRSAEIAERYVCAAPDRVRLVRSRWGQSGHERRAHARGASCRGRPRRVPRCRRLWLPEKITEQVATLEAIRKQGWSTAARRYGTAGIRTPRAAITALTSASSPIASTRLCGSCRNCSRMGPDANHVQRSDSSCRLRGSRWVRGGFPRAVRGSGLLRQAVCELGDIRLEWLWALYRQHDANETKRFSYVRYYRERRAFLEWLAEYLGDAQVNGEVRSCSRQSSAMRAIRTALP